jgi:hypothetical protein
MIEQKVNEIIFNELTTIEFIKQNEILSDLVTEKTKLTINVVKALAEKNNLSQETKNFICEVFNDIIATDEKNKKTYEKLSNANKQIKNNVLPRRYGKNKLKKDIENQGGTATNVQLTALSINKLKNIYLKLERLIISEMFSDERKLTDENYREIRSAIDIVENKLKKMQR